MIVQAQKTSLWSPQEIWSRILTQTMDAYIYAAAIACEADYFLTSDQALRDTANKINSPDEEWKRSSRSTSTNSPGNI